MAYNLQPLITILEGILDPHQTRWIVDDNNPQLQSLLDKATSLQQLLDKSSHTKLDSQIREVAHQAEDILESHMVHHMLSGSNCVIFTFSTPDLQQVTRDLNSIMEQLEKIVKREDKKRPRELDSAVDEVLKAVEVDDKKMPSSSSSSSSVLVGIDEDMLLLKDRLAGMQTKLEIIPIVGMGGVGKTTLARKLYEDPFIAYHFDYRAWITISQDYNMPQILKILLRCITGNECDLRNDELKDMLYKSLYGRKYLIVLDDIWSMKLWDEIRRYFPDNNNGSRIVITTRESHVANYVGSMSSHHQVRLLGESESWNLLRQLVFGDEDCPPVFQDIGQKIANSCGGLPLAISVIGGLLSKLERSEDVWKKIGDNVIATIAESNEQCYSILSLSYNHLPNHLKPCFLYMGAFPEDFEIRGSILVSFWVAEGFVKSNGKKSLEEEAEDWLKSLVERNLFMVREYSQHGKPKRYIMHDMLRDVCIRKCDEDKFLHVKNGSKLTFSNPRRMSYGKSNGMEDVNVLTESMSLTRSIICIGDSHCSKLPSFAFPASRLLRVLDFMGMRFTEFPTEIFESVNLRFLSINCSSRIPRGISRLWNLQTLIGRCRFDVPCELWQLSKLRNLKVEQFELLKDEEMNYSVMKKLQIMSGLIFLTKEASTWDGFLKSIPNIKKLWIDDGDRTSSTAIDLSHLLKLEILTCWYIGKVIFPCIIRKLDLYYCVINPGVLRTLCALHKLEVLRITECVFNSKEDTCDDECGDESEREEETCDEESKAADGDESESEGETCEEWKVADGDEFRSLQFLSLKSLDIVRWIADETNFPRLRHLRVDGCMSLEEIPSGIGEIPTLQLIELDECSESTVASAKRIEEEQQSEYGNYDLKLRIAGKFSW